MNRRSDMRMTVILTVFLIFVSIPFASEQHLKSELSGGMSLNQAVAQFNERAMKNETGKTQPALTEDEVVACIRAWNRPSFPVTNEILSLYQQIADTKILSGGFSLDFNTGMTTDPYHFDVWWIDLTLKLPKGSDGLSSIYSYRLRDRKLRCRLLTEDERKRARFERIPENVLKALERFNKKAREDAEK
jgi:hypothetical protein